MQLTEFKRTAASPAGGLQISDFGHTVNGIISVPDANVPVPAGGFPVIIFFHGKGAASSTYDLSRLYTESALPAMIKNNMFNREFIVVALQDQWATPPVTAVKYVLDHTVLTNYNADPNRVYATGLSFGGGMALAMGLHYPDDIAAIVSASPASLSTNANSFGAGKTEEQVLEYLAEDEIPVSLWVGMLDGSGGYTQRVAAYYQRLYNAAETQDYQNNKLFTFNKGGVGHGPWSTLYNGTDKLAGGKDMYEFILQFSKSIVNPPEEPEDPEQPEEPLSVYPVSLLMSDGTTRAISKT
jgi:pimeloyl-ACP methyl ester carboxylesterase